MKTKLYVLFGALLAFALYLTFFAPSPIPLSPLASTSPSTNYQLLTTNYVVMGFAPYWNMKKLSPQAVNSLTHLAYFNLHLASNGSLYTHVNRREEDPGYTNYKRLINGTYDISTPIIITFMPFNQKALDSILSSESVRQTALATVKQIVADSHAAGVNIDFEPLGDTPPSQKAAFTSFIQSLRQALTTHQLSISVYPSAGVKPRLWDLAALSPILDYIVVMTYDYTLPGSDVTGPNSPLRGAGSLYEHDITQNIAQITRLVSPRQILLGIPLYGYEWDTADAAKYSATESRGSVASLERIEKMLNEQTLELIWDRNSLTPYGVSTSSGTTTQVYFENPTSIKLKLDFVRAANLGGIAIWALGYEGNVSWLWPLIRSLNP